MFRILSLDGGGVYGSLQVAMLEQLEEKHPGFMEKVDMVAGTSIGGIIALLLAKGLSPMNIRVIFASLAKQVFEDSWTRRIASYLGWQAKYTNTALQTACESYFGDMTLGELKKKVLVPAYQLFQGGPQEQQWRAKFFHNIPGSDSDEAYRAVKVAMATSAAPTFFPTYENYCDGGLAENNPAVCAVAQTQDPRNRMPIPDMADIRVLSVGRDPINHYLEGTDLDWGWFKWVKPLIEIVMDRDCRVVHYQMSMFMGNNYFRLSPELPPNIDTGIDDYALVPELIQLGHQMDLTQTLDWLKVNW
jgi:hypothetical protein